MNDCYRMLQQSVSETYSVYCFRDKIMMKVMMNSQRSVLFDLKGLLGLSSTPADLALRMVEGDSDD